MPIGTIDRSAPPLFNQGPSALSRLILFSALALFLMVIDVRFHFAQPVRSTVGAVLYPFELFALKPVEWVSQANDYFGRLQVAQRQAAQAQKTLVVQSERASRADALAQENSRLRALLELRQRAPVMGYPAEVLYDAADLYSRKIVIDHGSLHGIVPGSPVIDAQGVLGQVTQVTPLTSEVTLVTDPNLSIPVQNTRTGARGVVFGAANADSEMELRFVAAHADLRPGDLLTTSGLDGIYPAGLPVATIERIEHHADSNFPRVHCKPQADVPIAHYVLALKPVGQPLPPPTNDAIDTTSSVSPAAVSALTSGSPAKSRAAAHPPHSTHSRTKGKAEAASPDKSKTRP
ncbi:MAG: rod shape-determining protein MreC [Burkholderiaceae bacterium]|jgi:rod shape-determining protein MreC|nr:rod shape-determining protein MreC [Burkholderiaceae bacterium]